MQSEVDQTPASSFIFLFYYCTESPFLQPPALQPLSGFQALPYWYSSPFLDTSRVPAHSSAPLAQHLIVYLLLGLLTGFRPTPNYTNMAALSTLWILYSPFQSLWLFLNVHTFSWSTLFVLWCHPRWSITLLHSTQHFLKFIMPSFPPFHTESSGVVRTLHASSYCLCISNQGFKPSPKYSGTTTAACNDVTSEITLHSLPFRPALLTLSIIASSSTSLFSTLKLFLPELDFYLVLLG